MIDNNGWADQPGVPMNPEQSGFHWVTHPADEQSGNGKMMAAYWNGAGLWFYPSLGREIEPPEMGVYRYHGPALTPAEVDARIEYARQSALAEATRRARHYATIVPMHGSLKCDIYEAAAQAATEIAASIEALSETPSGMVLVPREPTPAMIKSCLQAALDFMAETKTTEIHPGQTYPSPSENARRCWRAMVKAAEKGETND